MQAHLKEPEKKDKKGEKKTKQRLESMVRDEHQHDQRYNGRTARSLTWKKWAAK